ncbi:MAG: PspA/IM30 family protein [Egibacteraceae bacterium]
MGKVLRRWWRYLSAKLGSSFEERADPKIQIEQAIVEAQEQHKRLRETAANVIANQKKAEMDLERAMQELEKLNATTQQSLIMASEAERSGDAARATELTRTAEAFANQLIAKEEDVEALKQQVLSATQSADQAKAAVAQNSAMLQKKLGERQKLLSQLDQAKMAEQMSAAMESMSATVGEDVPTLDQVRDKIETRLAKAKGMAELQSDSVEGRMLEVEQAVSSNQASARLSEMRSKLGLTAAPTAEAAPAAAEQREDEAT